MIKTGSGKTGVHGTGPAPGPAGGALRVALVYFAVCGIWMFLSDRAAVFLARDPASIETVRIVKDVLYAVASALVLFLLVRGALREGADRVRMLGESYAGLQERFEELSAGCGRLAESEERHRLLFNALPDACCVHELVLGGDGRPAGIRALSVNPAFLSVAGAGAGESPEEAFLGLLPGSGAPWLERLAEVVSAGRELRFQAFCAGAGKELDFTVFRPAPGRFAAIIGDITDRRRMEKALDAETERLRVTLDSIGDGVVTVDTEGRVSMLNGIAGQMIGIRQREALGVPFVRALERNGGASGGRFASKIVSALGRGDTAEIRGDVRIRQKDDTEKLLSGRAAPIMGGGGAAAGYVVVFRDVTEQQKKEAEILYLSYHDLLTGLYNRNFFEEELHRLDTERQLPLSVIMGDANNLKLVNDVFGHREGDELLRAMAQVLRDSCRSEDIVSRWGGDEFTILLPHTDAEHAALVCRRIQARCRAYRTEERRLCPSISLGFDTKAEAGADIARVIKSAEDMMYKNKLLDSRSAHNDFLQAMRDRIGENDMETERHISRVTELCMRTGREMNMGTVELSDLKSLAMLHDIGKAAIDPGILNKPGGLTGKEWDEIKRHSGIGYRIVRSAPELVHVADSILGHHERWDGQGYPQGLKGETIPLASRILSVADAFDVMTRGRPYRQAVNQETALMEIFGNAGTQFDPEVVNAFASVLNSLTDGM